MIRNITHSKSSRLATGLVVHKSRFVHSVRPYAPTSYADDWMESLSGGFLPFSAWQCFGFIYSSGLAGAGDGYLRLD